MSGKLPASFLHDLHDHPREQVQPRLDGIELDVFRFLFIGTRRHPASCPFALNTAPAAGVVRNLISAFAADESFEPTPTPAWKTV